MLRAPLCIFLVIILMTHIGHVEKSEYRKGQ